MGAGERRVPKARIQERQPIGRHEAQGPGRIGVGQTRRRQHSGGSQRQMQCIAPLHADACGLTEPFGLTRRRGLRRPLPGRA